MVVSLSAWNNLFILCSENAHEIEQWNVFWAIHFFLDNYKDAVRLMNQYQTGCNTSELQSDAEQEGWAAREKSQEASVSVFYLVFMMFLQ